MNSARHIEKYSLVEAMHFGLIPGFPVPLYKRLVNRLSYWFSGKFLFPVERTRDKIARLMREVNELRNVVDIEDEQLFNALFAVDPYKGDPLDPLRQWLGPEFQFKAKDEQPSR